MAVWGAGVKKIKSRVSCFFPQRGDSSLRYHPQHIQRAVLPAQWADRKHGAAGPIHQQCSERFCTGPNPSLSPPLPPFPAFCLCIQPGVAFTPLHLMLYCCNHTKSSLIKHVALHFKSPPQKNIFYQMRYFSNLLFACLDFILHSLLNRLSAIILCSEPNTEITTWLCIVVCALIWKINVIVLSTLR